MISLTSPIKTPYHRLSAATKLALLCLFTTVLFLANSLVWQLIALVAVTGLYLCGGIRFARAGLAMLKPLWPFLAMILLWHLVTWTIGDGAVILLRLISAVALANLVTMTTRLDDMITVLQWLLSPFRVLGLRTKGLSIAIALVIRFTPVLTEKAGHLREAWHARSPKMAGWRIIVPFTLLAIDDADHVAEALRARGGLSNNS